MSGNRTRGVCVTGRNVTNYTNTDLFLFQNSKHWIRSLMFEFQGVLCWTVYNNVESYFSSGSDILLDIRLYHLVFVVFGKSLT